MEAIDSLLSQTRLPEEVVAVNDGSTDTSAAILERYGAFLKVVETPNHGLAAARNEGISVSRGPLIAFLDQDDRWAADKIQRFLATRDSHPETDLVFSDVMTLTAEGDKMASVCCDLGCGDPFRLLFRQNKVVSSTVMMKKSLWERAGPFRGDFSHPAAVVDWEFFLRASRCGSLLYIPEALTEYRIHGGSSLRSRREEVRRDAEKVLSLHGGDPRITGTDRKEARAVVYYESGVRHLAALDGPSARQEFTQCRGSSLGARAVLLSFVSFFPRWVLREALGFRRFLRRVGARFGGMSSARQERFYPGPSD